MASSPADVAILLTHANCSATIAENTRDKADTALAMVLEKLGESDISLASTVEDAKRKLYTVTLSNNNTIEVRWMQD